MANPFCGCRARFEVDCDCRPDHGYISPHLDPRTDPDPYAAEAEEGIFREMSEKTHTCAEPPLSVDVIQCSCSSDIVCCDCLPF